MCSQGKKTKLGHDLYDSTRSSVPQLRPLFSDDPSPSRRDPSSNMPQYTSRDVGDPSQIKKTRQSMADLKLRRLTELNNRLREDLDRERIPVSTASKRYVSDFVSALKRSPADPTQHHCLLQWHKGLHGTLNLGRCAQGRRPIRTATIWRLLSRDVEGGFYRVIKLDSLG
jgi:hypothetical protein